MKERTIIEEWDGPVVVNDDNWFSDIDEAVEHYWDNAVNGEDEFDINTVPEFAECCDVKKAVLDAKNIVESMDDYDCNVHSDDNWASNAVGEKELAELQEFLDGWLNRLDWDCWHGNGKWIALRPLVQEREKQDEHRQMMHQAMDYAGS